MTAKKPWYLPEFGPDDCLWLVTIRNRWAVRAHVSEAHAMHDAKTLQDGNHNQYERGDVRVTKVTIADYQAMVYIRETVRESLVASEDES